jgi:hypothetical protein
MKHMKNLTRFGVLLLIISTIFYACQPKTELVPSPVEVAPYEVSPDAEANLKIVHEYMDALLTNDQEKLNSLVGEGFMSYGPARKDSSNIEEIASVWAGIAKLRSNQDLGVSAMTALRVNEGLFVGDWVHLWGNYTATLNDGDYTFDVPWHSAYFIKDNKIVLTRTWYDSLAIALDLGAVTSVEVK